jgi:hypothetical protein
MQAMHSIALMHVFDSAPYVRMHITATTQAGSDGIIGPARATT